MDQLLQIMGAVMILTAFACAQFGLLDVRTYGYLVLNVVGSVLLAATAFDGRQWGFVLLEAAWGLVSLWSLGARLVERAQAEAS